MQEGGDGRQVAGWGGEGQVLQPGSSTQQLAVQHGASEGA